MNIMKEAKEVSDKIIVVLVVLAVLDSIIGTVLVFNVNVTTGSIVSTEPMQSTQVAKVELYVVNPDIPAPEGDDYGGG